MLFNTSIYTPASGLKCIDSPNPAGCWFFSITSPESHNGKKPCGFSSPPSPLPPPPTPLLPPYLWLPYTQGRARLGARPSLFPTGSDGDLLNRWIKHTILFRSHKTQSFLPDLMPRLYSMRRLVFNLNKWAG